MTKSQLKMINDAEAKAKQAREAAKRHANEFKRLNELADQVISEAISILAEEHKVNLDENTLVNLERDEKTKQVVGVKFDTKKVADVLDPA